LSLNRWIPSDRYLRGGSDTSGIIILLDSQARLTHSLQSRSIGKEYIILRPVDVPGSKRPTCLTLFEPITDAADLWSDDRLHICKYLGSDEAEALQPDRGTTTTAARA
jgi:hypothetical protein